MMEKIGRMGRNVKGEEENESRGRKKGSMGVPDLEGMVGRRYRWTEVQNLFLCPVGHVNSKNWSFTYIFIKEMFLV